MSLLVSYDQVRSAPPGVPRLLSVHAHPDDEASKGAATVAKAAAAGAHAVLVTCTGGEEGEILNPAMRLPEAEADLAAVRMAELERAADAIGYSQVVLLGYRDSGMPDSEANANPAAFANAPLDEAVGRLVRVIRAVRPHVVITYGDDQEFYPHPDHLKVHEISVPAFTAAGDPEDFPEAGPPWQPLKLYYSVWSMRRVVALHEKFAELGLESPYDERWLGRPSQDDRITTSVDVTGFGSVRRQALLAHATQIDPDSKFWFGLPDEEAEAAHPYDDYELAKSLVPTDLPEHDLWAGMDDFT